MDLQLQAPAHLVDRAVRRFEHESERRTRSDDIPSPRVITISRQLGSGGRRVAKTLSERLGWHLWDREILDVVASQSHLGQQARMFEALDERSQGGIEMVVSSLLGGVSKHVYLYLLSKAILIVAHNDAIILGRGAHLLLPDSLKVRIVASPETRIANMVRYEGCTEEAAQTRIRLSDQERDAFTQELASRLAHRRRGSEKRPEFDLVINTDSLDVPTVSSMVLTAAMRKFDIGPDELLESVDPAP